MLKSAIVNVEVCDIYKEPSYESEIVTQGLLWDKLTILSKKNNWFEVKQSDNYVGWVHSFFIADSKNYDNNKYLKNIDNWYIVRDRIVEIKKTFSNVSKFISIGTILPIVDKGENNYTLLLPNSEKFFIDKNKLLKFNVERSIDDIYEHILNLEGTPYKWGGKSGFGFDCSGFIQTIFKLTNIMIPRDSSEQANSTYFEKIDYSEKGALVFFSENNLINHVGIFINNHEFMHSSGYVKIESLISKNKNFNVKLSKMNYSFYKLK